MRDWRREERRGERWVKPDGGGNAAVDLPSSVGGPCKNRQMAEQDPAGSEPAAPKRRGRKPWPDHVKKSGKFVPPLLALDGLSLSNFRKDALPDLLWLGMSLLAWPVAGGSAPTIRALDIAQEEVDADVGTDSKDSIVIDGSLVAFERVPEPARERILDRLEAEGIYEDVVPKPVAPRTRPLRCRARALARVTLVQPWACPDRR